MSLGPHKGLFPRIWGNHEISWIIKSHIMLTTWTQIILQLDMSSHLEGQAKIAVKQLIWKQVFYTQGSAAENIPLRCDLTVQYLFCFLIILVCFSTAYFLTDTTRSREISPLVLPTSTSSPQSSCQSKLHQALRLLNMTQILVSHTQNNWHSLLQEEQYALWLPSLDWLTEQPWRLLIPAQQKRRFWFPKWEHG